MVRPPRLAGGRALMVGPPATLSAEAIAAVDSPPRRAPGPAPSTRSHRCLHRRIRRRAPGLHPVTACRLPDPADRVGAADLGPAGVARRSPDRVPLAAARLVADLADRRAGSAPGPSGGRSQTARGQRTDRSRHRCRWGRPGSRGPSISESITLRCPGPACRWADERASRPRWSPRLRPRSGCRRC